VAGSSPTAAIRCLITSEAAWDDYASVPTRPPRLTGPNTGPALSAAASHFCTAPTAP
jgi:hypothetical protein